MVRLVLINGAPGSGKSTLARLYGHDHALALALDVDVVRGMLGQWLEQPQVAGLAARRLALEMARSHLLSGLDVVVPQYLGRLDFVRELETLAGEVGAQFVEIALVSDPQDAVARFTRRAAQPENDEHRAATALQERSGGATAVADMYERLLEVIAARPATRLVVTTDGQIEATYEHLLEQINR